MTHGFKDGSLENADPLPRGSENNADLGEVAPHNLEGADVVVPKPLPHIYGKQGAADVGQRGLLATACSQALPSDKPKFLASSNLCWRQVRTCAANRFDTTLFSRLRPRHHFHH